MSSISPTAMPPVRYDINTAMANFEEEKTFFGPMLVVVTPYTRRRLRHLRSRRERERAASSLGRVIRRFRTGRSMLRKRRQVSYYQSNNYGGVLDEL
ncbi:hypothetical protein [Sansalvadorimonas verongulae]|uniref:hypothetical protein n=1 Tax=Sansalvadorimonas verongulae TaxID=2172824 RepID=UPI0012BC973C|nr:hypothetical protein [Sansalvadorimonas verongulae]MTI13558.1 hypothetical protein [Sansalvadorimonas verongulae]